MIVAGTFCRRASWKNREQMSAKLESHVIPACRHLPAILPRSSGTESACYYHTQTPPTLQAHDFLLFDVGQGCILLRAGQGYTIQNSHHMVLYHFCLFCKQCCANARLCKLKGVIPACVLHNYEVYICFVWQDAGGAASASAVGDPRKPLHLFTKYRTHSGILNAGAVWYSSTNLREMVFQQINHQMPECVTDLPAVCSVCTV